MNFIETQNGFSDSHCMKKEPRFDIQHLEFLSVNFMMPVKLYMEWQWFLCFCIYRTLSINPGCVCTVFVMCLYCVCTVFVLCLYCVCAVFVLCLYCVCTVFVLCLYCVCTVFVLCLYCVCTVFVLCLYCVCTVFVL